MHKQTSSIAHTLLTIEEAAALARVKRRTIHNWLYSRAISCIRIGRVVRFEHETFLAELKRFSTAASA